MYIFDYLGEPKTHAKITPGNTITAIGAEFIEYTERELVFTSGGVTEIVPSDWIVGVTSTAKAEIVKVVLTSGTWGAGTAAGTFTIKNQHGTFQSENLKVAAGTNDATIAANSTVSKADYANKGQHAKAALISVIANTALVAFDGGKPDQTALVGHSLPANSSLTLTDINAIKAFRCVDYTAASASTLNITLYF